MGRESSGRPEVTMRPARGGVPERPKGTGCKPVGSAYGGSNPPAPTTGEDGNITSRNLRKNTLVLLPVLANAPAEGANLLHRHLLVQLPQVDPGRVDRPVPQ